jgi:pantoate--beta-alanine ligase
MRLFESIAEWQAFRAGFQGDLGFVPTMGALHDGHASLVRRSVGENAHTLVSIFVNPTQFNDPNDLQKYPRTLEADLALLEAEKAEYVLLPTRDALYPDNYRYRISEQAFSTMLCGAHRPGHFDGVLTVVMKLLQLARPTRAYFGEKDYQQFCLIRDMAAAFFMDAQIIPCPTLREEDGLAMSSRNRLLSEQERQNAPLLYQALQTNSPALLEQAGFVIDYFAEHEGRRYAAATLGTTRLIDNVEISV